MLLFEVSLNGNNINPENYYHKIAMQSAGNKLSRDKIIKKIEQLEKEGYTAFEEFFTDRM